MISTIEICDDGVPKVRCVQSVKDGIEKHIENLEPYQEAKMNLFCLEMVKSAEKLGLSTSEAVLATIQHLHIMVYAIEQHAKRNSKN